MTLCPGSGVAYWRLTPPSHYRCPRCMAMLIPIQTGRVEWTLPDHTREGKPVKATP